MRTANNFNKSGLIALDENKTNVKARLFASEGAYKR